jgi:hypothetical protein
MRGNPRRIDYDAVRALAAQRVKPKEIARRHKCSPGYVRLIISGEVGGTDTSLSRKAPKSLHGRMTQGMPAIDHPAIVEGRTVYPSTVVSPKGHRHAVLKSGSNSAKIGRQIQKGKWKGFEVYTLTLEERATCPRSCHHWRSCFGGGMQQATRFQHGPDLEARLIEEVHALGRRHSRGFAVRLHVLGDFYSARYVELWEMLLDQVPQLHAFGFSARWDAARDPIADALVRLVLKRWERFAIRFSNAPIDECSTVSIEYPFQKPADAIVCPQQLGLTQACSTCAFCWQSKRPVAFVNH